MEKKKLFIYVILVIFVLIGAGSSFFISKLRLDLENFSIPNYISQTPAESNYNPSDYFINQSTEPPIDYQKEEKELIDGLVVIRNVDKKLILEKIEQGKEYLFRMIDEEENGVHKYYYALDDSFENRLHTIYTSSLIYTFLNLYDFKKDNALLDQILKSGEFVLSMQNKDEALKGYGAFHYSYYLDSKEREKKFVVGTTSKTIFTLLRLYKLTNDSKYLESAKLGADWLVTMQNPDGSMKSYIIYRNGKWFHSTKESLLYNGQCLSALSKLYKVTGDKKYYDTAEKIAKRFAKKYEEAGREYIKGEYRSKNPISNSWVVMSLMDFYRASQDDYYKDIIFELSEKILENQIKDITDPLNHGCFKGAYSTSGNGWLSEVMAETYRFCKQQGKKDCDKYKDAVVRVIRWLLQRTYSAENISSLKNPEMAIGGLFWNKSNKYVRTDSVCHGLNSYLRIINDLDDGLLISLPEKLFEEIF